MERLLAQVLSLARVGVKLIMARQPYDDSLLDTALLFALAFATLLPAKCAE